jgi:PAS domain S-box-containing protein
MERSLQKSIRILLVDESEEEVDRLKYLIADTKQFHYDVDWVDSWENALSAYQRQAYDACLVDYGPGGLKSLDIIQGLTRWEKNAPVILISNQGNYEIVQAAQQAGAADTLIKDQLNPSLLERTIHHAIEQKNFQTELERCEQERKIALQQEILNHSQVRTSNLENGALFQALTRNTSAGIFIISDMQIRYANPAATTITGYSQTELTKGKFIDLVHHNYRETLSQNGLGNDWSAELPSRYELKIIRKDGSERWLDLTTGPIEFEKQPAWIMTAFDITEREMAEQELRDAKQALEQRVASRTHDILLASFHLQQAVDEAKKRAEQLEALRDATSILLDNALDLDELLRNILEAACKAIPAAEKGALYLIMPDKNRLQARATAGFIDAHPRNIQLSINKGFIAESIRLKQSRLIKNVPANYRKSRPQPLRSAHSAIISPLLIQAEPLGAVVLTSTHAAAFSDADLNLLQSFTAAAAIAIHNAQLHSQVQHLSVSDLLTGVFNRRGFYDTGTHELERLHRYGHPFSMLYLDIDNFK